MAEARVRVLLVLAVVAVGSVARATPSSAHALIVASEPEANTVVTDPPSRVVLHFSEPVEIIGAGAEVLSGAQPAVTGAPTYAPGDRSTLLIPVQGLKPGGISVLWRVVGQDAHLVTGTVWFRFGAGADGGQAPARPSTAALPARWRPDAALAGSIEVTRLVGYVSMAVLVGGVTFLALAWPVGVALARSRWLLWSALVSAIATTLLAVALQGASLEGRSLASSFRLSVARQAFDTRFGEVSQAKLVLLAVAAGLLVVLGRDGAGAIHSLWWRVTAIAIGVGLVRTLALMGHAGRTGRLRSVANLVHVSAATVWVGGLIVLAVVVLPRSAPDELSAVLTRFSTIATVAVAALAVAGAVLLWPVARHAHELFTTGYGRMLLCKLGVVALTLVAASRSRAWVRDRVVASTRASGGTLVAQNVATWVTAELGLVALVLSLTAVLVGRTPPS